MNERLGSLAMPGFGWCVGLIALRRSWRFAFDTAAMRVFAETGWPAWIQPALGGIEIVAAVLFLLPVTTVVGGYALLAVFFFAAVLRLLHGWYDISALVLYAKAVRVGVADQERGTWKQLAGELA
jgi:hypothetical protein